MLKILLSVLRKAILSDSDVHNCCQVRHIVSIVVQRTVDYVHKWISSSMSVQQLVYIMVLPTNARCFAFFRLFLSLFLTLFRSLCLHQLWIYADCFSAMGRPIMARESWFFVRFVLVARHHSALGKSRLALCRQQRPLLWVTKKKHSAALFDANNARGWPSGILNRGIIICIV